MTLGIKLVIRICWRVSDKAFAMQDNMGKIRSVSIQYLQLLHPTEHILVHLPHMASFGWTTDHPNPMPNLHSAETRSKHTYYV